GGGVPVEVGDTLVSGEIRGAGDGGVVRDSGIWGVGARGRNEIRAVWHLVLEQEEGDRAHLARRNRSAEVIVRNGGETGGGAVAVRQTRRHLGCWSPRTERDTSR